MTELAKHVEIATRRIVRALTDVEVCELARKAGECEHTVREHERELDAMKEDVAETKKCIEMKLAEVRDYLQMIERGSAEETVECAVIHDPVGHRVGYLRLDTGEVAEVVAVREAQMTLRDVSHRPTPEQVARLDAFELEHGHRVESDDEDE